MSISMYPIRKMRFEVVTSLAFCYCVLMSACHRSSPSLQRQGNEERISGHPTSHDDPADVVATHPATDERPVDGVVELEAVTARKPQGVLADEIKLGDQIGNWQTEAFHEFIKERLKTLGKQIETRQWQQQSRSLISDEFECSDLRPGTSQLDQVFTDENLTVFRSSPTFEAKSMHVGLAGLARSLRRLTAPFRETSVFAVNFKVYRVTLNADFAESEMHVDTDGAGPDGGVEQNMVWTCRWQQVAQNDWKLSSIRLMRFEEVHYRRSDDGKLFSDCTESVLSGNDCFQVHLRHGIDHWRLRIEARYKIDYAALTGLAVADVNGDGLDDLYFCDVGGLPNRLFVQQTDGTVVDVSAEAGVDWLDRSYGALFADLDNDGDQDLIVSVDVSLLVMQNDGRGKFKVATELRPNPYAQSLTVVDYDNDGLLDIYVTSYGNNYETFADDIAPLPYHNANNGAPNIMFRNQGDWRFHDVTDSLGLNENNRKYSLGASWDDFDNDGDQDLYVANDFGSNNLYVNDMNRSGRFVDQAKTYDVEDFSAGMSADWGDYNNDGWMDLYVGNMFSGAGNRIAIQDRFRVGASDEMIGRYRRFARGNTLFRNGHKAPMSDVSVDAGVWMGRWSWSSLFSDINNDGWQDLLVTNGHVTGVEPDDL
jgi:hypothetical protein